MADYTFTNPMLEYVDCPGDVWLWNQIGTNPWASQGFQSNPEVNNTISIVAQVTFPFDWYLTDWFISQGKPKGDYTSLQLCALYDQYTSYLLTGSGGGGTTPVGSFKIPTWAYWLAGAVALAGGAYLFTHKKGKKGKK